MSRVKPIIGITTDIIDERFVIEGTYANAISRAGGLPIFLPTLSDSKSLFKDIVAKIDGIIFPGGRDMNPKLYNEEPHPKLKPIRPERTESEMIILEESLKRGIPVLGICNGMQLINVFFGGSLYQDIPSQISNSLVHENGSLHKILVKEGSLLQKIIRVENFYVKSYHHQSAKAIGKGLGVSASSPDGVIEAIEASDCSVLGIQWHPEREENSEISDRIFLAMMDGYKV